MKGAKFRRSYLHFCLLITTVFLLLPALAHSATEITDQIGLIKSRLYTDRLAGTRYIDVSLQNNSADSLPGPIIAVIDSISSDVVSVQNPDGTTDDGKPYFSYESVISGGQLEPGETSGQKRWVFGNVGRIRFTYTVKVYATPSDSLPPDLYITNPVNQSVINNDLPYITIRFSDNDTGIDAATFNALINGADSTDLFDVTDSVATCQITSPLNQGSNTLLVTISDIAGNASTVDSDFTVMTSADTPRYIFSIEGNDWVFSSPGDGTCKGYLNKEDLGISGFSDIVALSQALPAGNLYFTLLGSGDTRQSPADGTNSVLNNNTQLGLENGDQIISGHIGLSGTGYFSLNGQPDILQSIGDNTNSSFMGNYLLGLEDTDLINCLHIGYDNTIYFCGPDSQIVSQSTGGTSNTPFLTSADLGIPGAVINAFAILPETVPPTITITNPVDGAFINTTTPTISVSFSDEGSGINASTFHAEINGTDVTSAFTVTDSGASYQVPQDAALSVGANTLYVEIQDRVGNANDVISNFSTGILRAIPGATPLSGTAPLTVNFTTDGEDPAGTIVIFRWDFYGDGGYDTYDTVAQDYNRTFSNPGTYNATLHVWSSTGETTSASITINVLNNPPVASADVQPSNGEIPLTSQMTGTGTDNDGSIVLYEWDFDGDGIYDWSSPTNGNTSYTYTNVGTYNATFRVTDNSGLTATSQATTTVVRTGPIGSPTATASASATSGNAPLNVNLYGSATDPDNDVVLYEWDFNNDGTYDWSSATSGNTSHTYTEAGTHTASLRVTDSTGLTGLDQLLITVNIQTSLSVSNDTVGFIEENTSSGEIASASASSEYSGYPASNAIDGNTSSYWVAAVGDNVPNSWFEVTFSRPQRLDGFIVNWYSSSYKMERGRVEIYDESGSLIYSQETDLAGVPSQVSLPRVENAFRLRLVTVSTSTQYYHIITEFNVNSTPMADSGDSDEPEPTGTNINTSISASSQVSILIKDADENIARTLVNNEYRDMGSYNDYWDCKDDNGIVVNDGVYYAVMQYVVDGQVETYDLTNTTGGGRDSFRTGSGCDQRDSMAKPTFTPYEDEFSPIKFRLCKASEVTVFLGPLSQGGSTTRVRTIINRKSLPAGEHTVFWDGLDDQGNMAHPTPGDRLILGMWRYSLPNNAIYMTGGKPVISNVTTDPNYFNPFSNTCLENANAVNITYTVSEDVASVELRIISLSTNNIVGIVTLHNVEAGENNIFWNGQNLSGDFVESGDYQLILTATDSAGNESMLTTGNLVRLTY